MIKELGIVKLSLMELFVMEGRRGRGHKYYVHTLHMKHNDRLICVQMCVCLSCFDPWDQIYIRVWGGAGTRPRGAKQPKNQYHPKLV